MLNANEMLNAKDMITTKEMLNTKEMLKAKVKKKKTPRDQDTIDQARVVSLEWTNNANQDQLTIAMELINSVVPFTAIHISTVSEATW